MIGVYTGDSRLDAEALASELELPLAAAPDGFDALLRINGGKLELLPTGQNDPGPIAVDFSNRRMIHRRRGGHNEPLGRAAGVGKYENLEVVDATAGLGRDSFILADLGCRVTMLERSAAVFALLRDGLARGQSSEDAWIASVCSRMTLLRGEARALLPGLTTDVVYLDPMFPARRKSARVKKEMWLFQQLLEVTESPPALLDAALAAAHHRVVVKRPARAPALEDRAPAFTIPGKTVRFDVYLP